MSRSLVVRIGCTLTLLFIFWRPSTANAALLFPLNSSSSSLKLLTGNVIFLTQPASRPGKPTRLTIPGITVDAAVEQTGLTSDGTMAVPEGPDDVAWYESGQRPGEKGTAVMAGHYTSKHGTAAVFDNLDTLRPGDKIFTEDDTGNSISFVVREIRRYDPKADAEDVFISHDGQAHLNLITCAGTWSIFRNSYSDRLVVFADKEEPAASQANMVALR